MQPSRLQNQAKATCINLLRKPKGKIDYLIAAFKSLYFRGWKKNRFGPSKYAILKTFFWGNKKVAILKHNFSYLYPISPTVYILTVLLNQ